MFDQRLIVAAVATWVVVSPQAASAPPQAPRPVVRSSTALVEVDVVAFDLSDRASATVSGAGPSAVAVR